MSTFLSTLFFGSYDHFDNSPLPPSDTDQCLPPTAYSTPEMTGSPRPSPSSSSSTQCPQHSSSTQYAQHSSSSGGGGWDNMFSPSGALHFNSQDTVDEVVLEEETLWLQTVQTFKPQNFEDLKTLFVGKLRETSHLEKLLRLHLCEIKELENKVEAYRDALHREEVAKLYYKGQLEGVLMSKQHSGQKKHTTLDIDTTTDYSTDGSSTAATDGSSTADTTTADATTTDATTTDATTTDATTTDATTTDATTTDA
eukprot:Lankesteria_metandrocarpae@DN5798_c0_g1_i1.p1